MMRVDDDPADLAAVLQADGAPSLSGIDGFEDADAVGMLAADIGLARAHINDVRVRRRNRDRSDGADGNALITDGKPCAAGVFCLPDAAANGTHIEGVGLAWNTGDGVRPAAAHRTHIPPFQSAEEGSGNLPRDRLRLLGRR